MERNYGFMLLFFYLIFKATAISTENYLKCNLHHLDDCPELTICTQSGKESGTGECRCLREYIFNPMHNKNATDYCIRNPNIPPTGTVPGASIGGTAAGSKAESAIMQNEPPGPHHLIGGILIPIVLVLAIVGLVFIAKRLNLVRRARELFSTRRNRPFYEDVMMSNDNDDPPLI